MIARRRVAPAQWPYGVWSCADGRQVMFNRRYRPMFERDNPDAPAHPADPTERVIFVNQIWLYADHVPHHQRPAIFKPVLRDWGVAP